MLISSSHESNSDPSPADPIDGGPIAWQMGAVKAITTGQLTTLRYGTESAELLVTNGRLAAGAHYAEASAHARQSLARAGAILRLRARGRFFAHASAVVDTFGSACVFVGESGSGKSTLAFALVRLGWKLLGDDGVVLEPKEDQTIVHGWRSPLLVSADLDRFFPEMSSQRSRVIFGDERKRIPVTAESARRASLAKLIFVEQGSSGSFRPCSQAVALTLLMRQSPWVLLGDTISASHFNALRRVVSTTPAFLFRHGPAELERIGELFESAA